MNTNLAYIYFDFKKTASSNNSEFFNSQTKYYWITNSQDSDRLYVSARGYEESNKFQVVVFNRTVGRAPEPLSSKSSMQRLGLMAVVVAQCVFLCFF
jgi:hypothetical protein